jgi:hypothetical protein
VSAPALSRRQERGLGAILAAPSVEAAAQASGIGVRTLRRWLAEDEGFRAAIRDARRRALEHASARLAATTAKAVSTLEALLDETADADAQTRCRAALGVLQTAVKAAEVDDLVERVEALERRAAGPRGRVPNPATFPRPIA